MFFDFVFFCVWFLDFYRKGNVARAVFYVALIYGDHLFFGDWCRKGHIQARSQLKWFEEMRKELLTWNRNDIPDQEEIQRNKNISKVQGNTNPFVDDYRLVDAYKQKSCVELNLNQTIAMNRPVFTFQKKKIFVVFWKQELV